jgi:hypothetical protein
MFTKDNLKLGLILGIIAPFIGIAGYYFLKVYPADFLTYIKVLGREKRFLTNAVTFSLLVNAIFFTIYVNSNKDKTAKGIFAVTVIYVLIAIILKFIY